MRQISRSCSKLECMWWRDGRNENWKNDARKSGRIKTNTNMNDQRNKTGMDWIKIIIILVEAKDECIWLSIICVCRVCAYVCWV